ncbi:MAG: sporulation protein [Ruminococcaceae bacterium]|nr:sporulation protein [Oscillospiraceae bacterium]
MAEKGIQEEKKHALSLTAREVLSVCGVTQVDSFDEQSVVLHTDCGELAIEGTDLHVGTLDMARGVVEVTGHVSALYYGEGATAKRGWRTRLFG